MTRKEELGTKARQFMETQDRYPYLTAIDLLYKELLQVEREVWEKVERYYSHQIHHDMDDYPDKFVKWLKSQQQELT